MLVVVRDRVAKLVKAGKSQDDVVKARPTKEFEEKYESLHHREEQFGMAEALTSVAIALLGITALTHRRRLLYVGWTFAGLGVLMGIAGFAHLNLHPAFLAHLLGG